MTDPDNIPIFNMSPPQVASSSNSDINEVRPQFPMNTEHFEPCSSLFPSHSFTRPRISDNEHSIYLMDPPSMMNHPPSNNLTDIIFFKTRLCANFRFLGCGYGENCIYAHGKEELRQPAPNWKELKRLQLGGNRDDYSFLHKDTAKFRNNSWKTRESDAITIRTIGNNLEDNKTVTEPPRGTYWKTKICPKWKHTRSCTYGDDCNFSHGDAELQVPGGGIEAEAAVAIANSTKTVIPTLPTTEAAVAIAKSTKAVIPTLQTTSFSAKYLPTLPPSVLAATEEEKKAKKELLRNKTLKKINRIYGDWIDDLPPDRPDFPREP